MNDITRELLSISAIKAIAENGITSKILKMIIITLKTNFCRHS